MSKTKTFIPFIRKGVSNKIPSSPDGLGRAKIEFTATANGKGYLGNPKTVKHTKKVELIGPGDILGIPAGIIGKTNPPQGNLTFESNFFPYIEFKEIDFPWRYTPLKPSENKLNSWLVLFVLEREEFELKLNTESGSHSLRIVADNPNSILPSPEEHYAWCHGDLKEQSSLSELGPKINKTPKNAVSRLLCPRKLKPNTHYQAFLVPAFESGRIAGLFKPESDILATPRKQLSWGQGHTDFEYPIYFQWEFSTGEVGDFETLARKLGPISTSIKPETRKITVINSGCGLNELTKNIEIPVKTAFHWPGTVQTDFDYPEKIKVAIRIMEILNVASSIRKNEKEKISLPTQKGAENFENDPIVSPPVYGSFQKADNPNTRYQIKEELLEEPQSWWYQINLLINQRALAGMGAQIIKENQEEIMDLAWDIMEEVKEVNRKINEGERILNTNQSLISKHGKNLSQEQCSSVLENNLSNYQGSGLEEKINNGDLSRFQIKQSFRRLRLFERKISKKNKKSKSKFVYIPQTTNSGSTNIVLQSGNPVPWNYNPGSTGTGGSSGQVSTSEVESPEVEVAQHLTGELEDFTPNWDVFTNDGTPKSPFENQKSGEVSNTLMNLELKYPLITPLIRASKSVLFPKGYEKLKTNEICLFEMDQSAIESLLLGANHELIREFIWREFPADIRTTFLKSFLNRNSGGSNSNAPQRDIVPIDQWSDNSPLGNNGEDSQNESNAIMMIKGDLIHRYPDTIIEAIPIKNKNISLNDPLKIIPNMIEKVSENCILVNFPTTVKKLVGTDGADEGFAIIFRQNPENIQFGLDEIGTVENPPLNSWNELSWAHVNSENEHLNLSSSNITIDQGPKWASSSAHMASIFSQAPILIGLKASLLIPTLD